MSTTLRIALLVCSLLTAIWILRKISRNRVRQEDATYWICFAMILAILGVFPEISYAMADLLGIISPSNFVFLAVIALLAEKMLSLSIQVSTLSGKVEVMAAELAIRSKELNDQIDRCSENKEVGQNDK